MLRSVSEPSSQKVISRAANGFGARFNASEIPAPARLATASPARMSTNRLARGPATNTSSATDTKAPMIAAAGKANDKASTAPNEMATTPANPAAEGAPNSRSEEH